MNELQYYLVKVAEEAAEVAQMALKTSQFGADEKMPGQPYTNFERLVQEFTDLTTMVNVLVQKFGLPLEDNEEFQEACLRKLTKVAKYLEYSRQLGLVQPLPVEHHPV